MPWERTKQIPAGQACQRCGERYQQGHGLCRTCERELLVDLRTTQQREQDKVEAERAQLMMMMSVHVDKPRRELTIGHMTFEVVWDGSK